MPLPNLDLLYEQARSPATEGGAGIMTEREALSQGLSRRKCRGLILSLIPSMHFSRVDKCPGGDCQNWLVLFHKTQILQLLTGECLFAFLWEKPRNC